MSSVAPAPSSELNPGAISGTESVTDSLISGLSFMLLANVIQRGFGFVRNLIFCRLLEEDGLGLWALASSFFILVAPLAVLGLPGTFGRLVESYRVQGQLASFLRRVSIFCAIGTLLVAGVLLFGHAWLGYLLFGIDISFGTMLLIVLTLVSIILFNTITELLNGLRRGRMVSSMHTYNSLSFTAISLIGLVFIQDWQVVVAALGLSSLIGLIPAMYWWFNEGQAWTYSARPLSFSKMFQRVMPFALSVWCINLLVNLFDAVDRYMLLYLAPAESEGTALVGQFHSARILPLLLTSLTLMISSLVLPYLATDWEIGKRDRVRKTMQITFKLSIVFFFGMSILALAIAPYLFDHLLRGKYEDGLSILPIALVHCCFSAAAVLLQNYYWCAEKGRVIGYITACGLICNVFLNIWWVPIHGLHGAMAATAVSGALILLATIVSLRRYGVVFDRSSVWIGLLPLSLMLGAVPSMIVAVLFTIGVSRLDCGLTREEKDQIDQAIRPLFQRFGIRMHSIWH
jgi:O-antigen/teichoic acid export membrane protein